MHISIVSNTYFKHFLCLQIFRELIKEVHRNTQTFTGSVPHCPVATKTELCW